MSVTDLGNWTKGILLSSKLNYRPFDKNSNFRNKLDGDKKSLHMYMGFESLIMQRSTRTKYGTESHKFNDSIQLYLNVNNIRLNKGEQLAWSDVRTVCIVIGYGA